MVKEVKVTKNYQITIPLEIREKLGIKAGDKVVVICEGEEIKVVPKKKGIRELKGIIRKIDIIFKTPYIQETNIIKIALKEGIRL